MNFDDWFNTGKNWQYDKDACEDAFEAGRKSRQEDVDKLIMQINEALDAFEDGELNHCHKALMKALGDTE